MTSDLQRALRRLKPHKRLLRLARRPASALSFVDLAQPPPKHLLLDSTVYIDELQGRLPGEVETLLRAATLWHSPVTAAELVIAAGLLDPGDSRSAGAIDRVASSLARRPLHRTLALEPQVWVEAALATGILARLQRYLRADRVRLLNDALLLFTAERHGCTLLTRNLADFDLLQQLSPSARVLFYLTS